MTVNRKRALLRGLLVTSMVAGLSLPTFGAAAQAAVGVKIARQDLGQALIAFSRQSGRQILFAPELVRGKRANAIAGQMGVDAALAAMLRGSGLAYKATASGAYLIVASSQPIRPVAAAAAPVAATPVQTAEATQTADPAQAVTEEEAPDVIVTGSARRQRRFDVSYAVNSLGQDDIKRLAPLNFADLLGKLPGIQVEPTGGEVQNITRIRGIPTDDGYAQFQQDGLPLFHDMNGNFFRGDSLNRYDLMTERVEVVRGGPAPIYGSQAAAIVNSITASGTDTPHGKVQVTAGTTDLYRLDAMLSGPLGDDTYYAIGGFIRRDGGQRDNGFPNDRGGQIRANLKHDFGNGFIRVTGNYLNDHNVFYLPIPVADPRNPAVSLDKYIDFFHGTLNSPYLQNVPLRYRDANGVVRTDVRNLESGRHMEYGNFGVQFEGDFDKWLVSFKGGYTRGRLDFDALYSTSNPADATTFANGFLTASRTAFGANVSRLGYALAGTYGQTPYDPASASGLVVQAQYRGVGSSFYSGQSDLSVTRSFETGIGKHDVRVGVYGAAYGLTNKAIYQDYLFEVRSQPRPLDLYAYSASGQILGRVTDNGVLRYGTTLNQGEVDTRMWAVYANDTWEVVRGLRIDGGIRHEEYTINGYGLLSTSVNLGDPTTLADNTVRGFTGARQQRTGKPRITNWTVGANYDVNDHLGGYARASHLEVPPQSTSFYGIDPVILTTKADQFEAGLKASFGRNYLYLTGFYTKFNPFNASFVAFNPATGRNDQSVPFIGEATVKGIEADGTLAPVSWFFVSGSLTYQNPQYKNLQNSSGADPSAVNGNQIIREPKWFGNVRPTFAFERNGTGIELYGRYEYTGLRYVDLFNQTRLPAFGTFGLGVTLTRGTVQFQVVGDNITNARGLTEGNPRTDQLSGQSTRDAIYGRPIFGRSVRFILSKSW
ncbi:outer membrane receptor protein involved in Fe transport [Sphingomonas jinjuensis]|uniref:Outer membrane receptor protein involved in Fe transport n=1 Tax=Sphingomonas jinjuensis TaxID=535907 RepID=A0A840FEU2_9SPHN|nr:TonB-dependent receptor [Sphingomonas jinjuensis]MBB4154254.1 outer membrane receptor protein involved in Fe transport [Sphingomonas jinjuensis]